MPGLIEAHKCSICNVVYTKEEGGVEGDFGILPVQFCPTCYSSMVDMVQQLEGDYFLNGEE
jgi:rubredoxin|tara:strand:- start:1342 stop:1524 length:183 start_codon:yes stop_codon:yes gene_type:complete